MTSDPRWFLLVAAVLVVLGSVVVILLLKSRRQEASPDPHSPAQRLAVLVSQRSDYRIQIGVPPEEPISWAVVSRVADGILTVEGHGDIPLTKVTAFVVAYPNGQLVDFELAGLPVPAGVTGLSRSRKRHHDLLQLADLEEGRKYIEIRYGPSRLRPNDRDHYSTTLVNVSRQRIRVLRFAGYTRTPEGWRLNTVTGSFYSAKEFREWYGLGLGEWIEPGKSANDPNNYGGPPVLWAYYCQTEDGNEFVAGGVLD